MKVGDNVPRTPEIQILIGLLQDPAEDYNDSDSMGLLSQILNLCQQTMAQVQEIAKEVGGDPSQSIRYQYAEELAGMIYKMQSLLSGTYSFSLPALLDQKKP